MTLARCDRVVTQEVDAVVYLYLPGGGPRRGEVDAVGALGVGGWVELARGTSLLGKYSLRIVLVVIG